MQPQGLVDGPEVVGTVNGVITGTSTVNDVISQIAMTQPGSDAINYNFAELPAVSGGVQTGQTAGIGFWQNKNGQALIKSLNGGPSATQLANWLAATFPYMYGASAGPSNSRSWTGFWPPWVPAAEGPEHAARGVRRANFVRGAAAEGSEGARLDRIAARPISDAPRQ